MRNFRKRTKSFHKKIKRSMRLGAMTRWQGSLKARGFEKNQKARKSYQKYKVGK